ncbi:uncharacterized protein BDCG_07272 [Blastomyces dermatitidis ER-3]|uniref:Uncharacterized protein n=3 Tax=Blastomyces TaxID=229219 RepID=A0A179UX66_BLAGS|nr:uncharacterized protein BDBG_07088 [Blastomyces gilchristii SLH14081]XP_031579964.1 hypothetical protein, variant [Blastomyces gilchristii SLH14081]XP_045278548.1 uncharacterized protein BDCG_07272 [Blastomyces dermatitidis ER-3]EGE78567.1 hypothetical protein BDDG_01504 [Blastomyces dermatitidis ATCC 18188]EEQ92152.2 hypothetical protein BDCG_07272 [Blastomyces dermatitidis ER-3]OAT11640.1 hypothetical protein BDBG_07088 [Blastomyces gilchristii SLH14081]OAT11641.1 hypothetical protein, v
MVAGAIPRLPQQQSRWTLLLTPSYLPRMTIRYRNGTCHNIRDALSCLHNLEDDSEEIPSDKRGNVSQVPIQVGRQSDKKTGVFVTSASDIGIALSDEIKNQLCSELPPDPAVRKIFLRLLRAGEDYLFKIKDGLFLFRGQSTLRYEGVRQGQ